MDQLQLESVMDARMSSLLILGHSRRLLVFVCSPLRAHLLASLGREARRARPVRSVHLELLSLTPSSINPGSKGRVAT